jgi:hypothetical protein
MGRSFGKEEPLSFIRFPGAVSRGAYCSFGLEERANRYTR